MSQIWKVLAGCALRKFVVCYLTLEAYTVTPLSYFTWARKKRRKLKVTSPSIEKRREPTLRCSSRDFIERLITTPLQMGFHLQFIIHLNGIFGRGRCIRNRRSH